MRLVAPVEYGSETITAACLVQRTGRRIFHQKNRDEAAFKRCLITASEADLPVAAAAGVGHHGGNIGAVRATFGGGFG
jgi:hypothetical protein